MVRLLPRLEQPHSLRSDHEQRRRHRFRRRRLPRLRRRRLLRLVLCRRRGLARPRRAGLAAASGLWRPRRHWFHARAGRRAALLLGRLDTVEEPVDVGQLRRRPHLHRLDPQREHRSLVLPADQVARHRWLVETQPQRLARALLLVIRLRARLRASGGVKVRVEPSESTCSASARSAPATMRWPSTAKTWLGLGFGCGFGCGFGLG